MEPTNEPTTKTEADAARIEQEVLMPQMVDAILPHMPDTKGFVLVVVDLKHEEVSLVTSLEDASLQRLLRELTPGNRRELQAFEPAAAQPGDRS